MADFFVQAAQDGGLTLYKPGDAAPADTGWFLLNAGAGAPTAIATLQDSWAAAKSNAGGCYLFFDDAAPPPPDPAAFLSELQSDLLPGYPYGSVNAYWPRFAWRRVAAPAAGPDYLAVPANTMNQVGAQPDDATTRIAVGRWQLVLGTNSNIALGSDGASFVFTPQDAQNETLQVQFVDLQTGSIKPTAETPAAISLALSGAGTMGQLSFTDWKWDWHEMSAQFGCEMRLFQKDLQGAGDSHYKSPIFYAKPPATPFDKSDVPLSVYLNPLAPGDATRSRMVVDTAKDPVIESRFVIGTSGQWIQLTPKPGGDSALGAGFAFQVSPNEDVAGTNYPGFYLAPAGGYAVAGTPGVPAQPVLTVMCGLSGTEFLLLEDGDELHFEAGNKAAMTAHAFDDAAPYTTPWMKVARAGAGQGAASLPTSYCAQSAQSAYFSLSGGTPLPEAVGVSLVPLGDIPLADQPAVPMAPYAGFYGNAALSVANPNPAVAVATVTGNENAVVAPQRRSLLHDHFNNETGPIFFSLASGIGFDGGYVRTPVGLLAQLNGKPTAAGQPPAGSMKEMFFATSPQNQEQVLALNPPVPNQPAHAPQAPVVNPHFSNNVMSDNVFLVATGAQYLEPWANEIQLGDFMFRLDLRLQSEAGPFAPRLGVQDPNTILLFKFMTGISLKDLVADMTRWTFLGGANAGTEAEAQARINAVLDTSTGPLFADFVAEILENENWTGILALNCGLDYAKLPKDIQMLLGGMDPPQELRAHHFGVNVNRVNKNAANQTVWDLEQSSLFAIIKYDAQPVAPTAAFKFQLLKLDVSYRNSKLVTFQSRIAMSIKEFFQNDATLVVAPPGHDYTPPYDTKANGTIEIDGQYIEHEDGTGTLIFDTKGTRVYELPGDGLRVLKSIRIMDASLSPTSRKQEPAAPADPTTITVGSAFTLDCLLYFDDSIGGDLFSYGEFATAPPPGPPDYGPDDYEKTPDKGLYVTGYTIAMNTVIDVASNSAVLDPAVPTPDYGGLGVYPQQSEGRDKESLAKFFPNTITDLVYKRGGMAPTAVGAWRLQGKGITDTNPVFSLDFEIPLGNLGGLVSGSGNLFAHLYLGWTPGTGRTADTVGAVFILPAAIASATGFRIEGLIDTDFKGVKIEQVEIPDHTFYALRFLTYQGSLMNVPLFFERASGSTGSKDLALFGRPAQPSGGNPILVKVDGNEDSPGYPKLTAVIEIEPKVFLGRALKIETDFMDPDPIDDAIEELVSYPTTLEGFAKQLYAGSIFSSGDAGIAFALKLALGSFAVSVLLHDDDFYGLKIGFEKEKEKEKKKKKPNGDGGGDADESDDGGSDADEGDDDKDEKGKGGLRKAFEGFEFMILYRKVSDNLGVFSGDIYLSFGKIDVGSIKVELPDFSISIWTNGDWRFSIGWPITNHPLTLYVQAGPFPLVFKTGFYLAKLRGADNPGKFGDFALIWAFGAALEGGLGRKFESGPFTANATVTLGLTMQGFLGSCDGKMTEHGVDYEWFAVTLAVTGTVKGKVDFKVIVIEVSLTLSMTLGLAIETGHETVVSLTFQVKAKASIKIVFVRISFSFSATINLGEATFGSGPKAALSGPKPPANFCALRDPSARAASSSMLAKAMATRMRDAMGAFATVAAERDGGSPASMRRDRPLRRRGDRRRGYAPMAAFMAMAMDMDLEAAPMLEGVASPVPSAPIPVAFFLQATAIVKADLSASPQGVATLLVAASEADGTGTGAFGIIANAIADYLFFDSGWATGPTVAEQLANLQDQLQANPDWVDAAITKRLPAGFTISGLDTTVAGNDKLQYAAFPAHPSLAVSYKGQPAVSLGSVVAPADYEATVARVFGRPTGEADASSPQPIAGVVFDGYFQTIGKEIVRRMIEVLSDWPEPPAPQPTSLTEVYAGIAIGEISGLVSRFLMGGTRLPDPDNGDALTALYLLTRQQFDLDLSVLTADLTASGAPAWLKFAAGDKATSVLDKAATAGLSAYKRPDLKVLPVAPMQPVNQSYPLSQNQDWTDAQSAARLISRFSLGMQHAIETATGDLFLKLEEADGSGATADMAAASPWAASAALVMSVQLNQVRDPADPSKFLPHTYAMAGVDEVNRAFLQELLKDDAAAPTDIDLIVSSGGALTSVASSSAPSGAKTMLVKGNFATATSAAGLAATMSGTGADCPTHANMTEFRSFLQLVWECSVVHTGGFYLDVEGLDPDLFTDGGSATLMLLTQLGPKPEAAIVPIRTYVNAVVGAQAEGKALLATLASDSKGTPIKTYAPAYPGGSVGWQIVWTPDSTEADAESTDFLERLYHMFSYRVSKVSWTTPPFTPQPWSDPVNAQHDGGSWVFQSAFAAAPLMQASNRYAAIGDNVGVDVRASDVFGNALPDSLAWSVDPLDVVYNDPLIAPGAWPRTTIGYMVKPGATPTLELQMVFDTTVDAEPSVQTAHQLQSELDIFEQLADQLSHGLSVSVSTSLAATGLGDATLLEALQAWVKGVLAWYAPQVASPPAGPPAFAPQNPLLMELPLDKAYPASWPADLMELTVDLMMARAPAGPFAPDAPESVKAISASIPAQKKPPAPQAGTLLNALDAKDTTAFTLAVASTVDIIAGKQLRLTSPSDGTETVVVTTADVPAGATSVPIDAHDFSVTPQPKGSIVTVINPVGLTQFAQDFEAAYADYTAEGPLKTAGGRLKIAEGVNAKLTSSELGKSTVWVTRLKTGGATIKPDASSQNYYLPPPLSTRLLTAQVPDVTDYSGGLDKPVVIPHQTFSAVDLDKWAAGFLFSLEEVFGPVLAPPVARIDVDDPYGSFAESKISLAGSIAETLADIFDGQADGGRKQSAKDTFKQFLLATLENDYGTAAVAQVEAEVSFDLGADEDGVAPQAYGGVRTPGDGGTPAELPYALTNVKLPMKTGTQLMNFLVSARDPGAQKYFELHPLFFQMTAMEHFIRLTEERCGYVPSQWLSYVLKDPPPVEAEPADGALTTEVGNLTVPVPLRTFPPRPFLVGQTAVQVNTPTSIAEAMTWAYSVEVGHPRVAQDSLLLAVHFNLPVGSDGAKAAPAGARGARLTAASAGTLFDALARYQVAYPALAPVLTDPSSSEFPKAVEIFTGLVEDVRQTWGSWTPPVHPADRTLKSVTGDEEVWTVRLDEPDIRTAETLEVRMKFEPARSVPPAAPSAGLWPAVAGYTKPDGAPTEDPTAGPGWYLLTYTIADKSQIPATLALTWSPIWVGDFQSANTKAWVWRNFELAPPSMHKTTNEVFVYTSEIAQFPNPVVPLITANADITIGAGAATLLDATRTDLLAALLAQPAGSLGTVTPTAKETPLEGALGFGYELLANPAMSAGSHSVFLPLYLLQETLDAGSETRIATLIQQQMVKWKATNDPQVRNSNVHLQVTLFADRLGPSTTRLPVVKFNALSIPVTDTPAWWGG